MDTKPNADQVYRWLGSGDPRVVAWGAHFAGKSTDPASISKMLQLVDQWVSRQADWRDDPQLKAMAAVLDALIQRNEKVPAAGISSIASSFPTQAMVLASRHPVREIEPLLLSWYERRTSQDAGFLPRFAAMMLAKAPPSGFAASVLAESQELVVVNVRSDAKSGGVKMGVCGDSFGRERWQGWPPVYVYRYEENDLHSRNPVLVQAGGYRVTYSRVDIDAGWGSCSHRNSLTDTLHYVLAEMLGIRDKKMPWPAQQEIFLQWQNEELFRKELESQVAAEEPKLRMTVEALFEKGILTQAEADSVRPKLVVSVIDDRVLPLPPLPRIEFYDPRTVLVFGVR